MPKSSLAETPHRLGFRMPAEWDPHRSTWLTWPASRDWPGKLEAVRSAYCDLVRALTRHERVDLLIRDRRVRESAKAQLAASGVDLARIDFHLLPTNRTWTRDNLPAFVTDARRKRLGAVKWRFNGWARYRDHELDDRAGLRVAGLQSSHWQPKATFEGQSRRVVLEGGAIDVDGLGTLLTTERCLLGGPNRRNPGLERADIEQLLLDYLGATRVVWLEDGIAGDDTQGHVDDFARFVAPGRVVLASEPDASDPNHRPLAAAREVLERARDARGQRLEVVTLPMPRPVLYRGERLPASYANFYIANEQVLVPTFNDENDRIALGILAELFPGRRVVGIHARDLVVGLGTLHCSTQQEPAVA